MPKQPPPPSTAYLVAIGLLFSTLALFRAARHIRHGLGAREVVPLRVSLEDRPRVIAGVPGLGHERPPLVRPEERHGRENPAEEDLALGLGLVRVDPDVAAAGCEPLDLPHR